MPVRKTHEKFMKEIKLLNRLHHDHSKVKYDGNLVNIIIICKYHGLFETKPKNYLISNHGCKYCGFAAGAASLTKSTEQFIKEAILLHDDRFEYLKSIYTGAHKNLIITCKEHGDFLCTPNHHLNENKKGGCSFCSHGLITNEIIDQYLIDNDKKIKRITDYIKCQEDMKFQCLICDYVFDKRFTAIKHQNAGCDKCGGHRINEKRVKCFLKENNIITEKLKIKLPILKRCANPDFYIPSLNLIIEYNGCQHYKPTKFGNMTDENSQKAFIKQQIRDQQLREYCYENNIEILEIDGRKYTNWKLINYLHEYFNIPKPIII